MLGKCFKWKDNSLSQVYHIHTAEESKRGIQLGYSLLKDRPPYLGSVELGEVNILKNIHFVKGDITHTEKGVIAHQVNTLGVSGSGVVVPIKAMYAQWEEEYKAFIESNKEDLLGKVLFNTLNSDLFIANVFSQFSIKRFPSQNTCLDSLKAGLEQVKTLAKNGKVPVYLPYKLASVRGGMSWEEQVLPLIADVFEDGLVEVYIVDYDPTV